MIVPWLVLVLALQSVRGFLVDESKAGHNHGFLNNNLTNENFENNTCMDCINRIQNLETVINAMKQNFEKELLAVKSENIILKNMNDRLEQDLRNLTDTTEELRLHDQEHVRCKDLENEIQHIKAVMLSIKENYGSEVLKLKDHDQAIYVLQTSAETSKQQINVLTNTQAARAQDFLALYNHTLSIQSDVSSTKGIIEQISDYHNLAKQEIYDTLEKIVNQSKRNFTTIDNRKTSESLARGITYVRWSRKQCPSHAQLIYSGMYLNVSTARETEYLKCQGYAGGGKYNEPGSSAEPVCLPPDPDFNKTTGNDDGRMYGAEFFDSNFFASDSSSQDVPCAVCRVSQASSVIIIPGKHRCYSGWRMEYHGYLASNAYNQAAAGSFVCIDIQPEYVAGGSSWSSESKLFYPVTAKCGSLRCPPYKQDHPLTCVVCSK